MKRTIQYGRKLLTLLSVLSILAVSVFSALVGVDFTAVAETSEAVDVQIWKYDSQKSPTVKFAGEGTAVNPYLIENGDQLLKMVKDQGKSSGQPNYYKLTKDIYLNDVSNYKKWGSDDFDMSTLNNWNEPLLNRNLAFAGSFDGDGHYIYGLYSEGYQFAAFIPGIAKASDSVEPSAQIKNVHFRNSYCVNNKFDECLIQPEGRKLFITSKGNTTQYLYAEEFVEETEGDKLKTALVKDSKKIDQDNKDAYIWQAVIADTENNSKGLMSQNGSQADYYFVNEQKYIDDKGKEQVAKLYLTEEIEELDEVDEAGNKKTVSKFVVKSLPENTKPTNSQVWTIKYHKGEDFSVINKASGNYMNAGEVFSSAGKYSSDSEQDKYPLVELLNESDGTNLVRYNPNDSNVDPNFLYDKEGYNKGGSVSGGDRTWNDAVYGSASVILGYIEQAVAINNCSVRNAYVKASAFTSAMISVVGWGNFPTIKNCLVADITMKTTCKEDHVQGVEGAVFNTSSGGENSAVVEGVIVAGAKVYGADDRDATWNGYKVPTASYAYQFKDVYSNVEHKYTVEHASHGSLAYTDTEINVVKDNYLKGYKAQEKLDLDWEHNWIVVEDDYPIPAKQFIVPTGEAYYADGGPKSAEDYWDGTAAKNFAAGTGTVEDPYLIENCEQFYLMASTLRASGNYKIADGVKALYFNKEVKGLSYAEAMNVLKSKKMNNYKPGESNNFSGYFDGNGVKIYGVKAEGSLRSALIPQANNSTLKNFTVENSYFYASDTLASESSKTEGAAAIVADLASNACVNIRNVAVINCKVNSNTAAAGFVACSHINGAVFIDDCIVAGGEINSDVGSTRVAAFVAGAKSGAHTIKNSISYGIYPAADNVMSYMSNFKNVYTDFDAPTSLVAESTPGITKVETEKLKGEAVKSTAKEFDWNNTWKTTKDIPELKNHVSTFGTKNEAWTGAVSDVFAGGSGTQSNPYQIDTAERLAQMLNYCRTGAYYTLTANIYLNDVDAADWTKNAKQWYTSEDVNGFDGIFDGNNYTIYGLYNKDVKSGVYAGLIPVLASGGELRNVKIDNAYLSGNKGATIGAVVGATEDNAPNIMALRAAKVGKNVTIEGAANAGGIVGLVSFTKLRMDNSIFMGTIKTSGKAAGLVGEVAGKLDIKQSVSVGIAPFAASDKIECSGIYTDASCNIKGVTVLKNSQMIGKNAEENMTELVFGSVWSTTEEYPAPTYKVQSFDGVKDKVWSGEIATNYAGGKGTKLSPYLIATPEQLAKLIKEPEGETNKKHYKLVADIYLNDVSDELWQARVGCNSWFNGTSVQPFQGTFDGDGHVVFGIYYNYKSTPQNTYAALFPRVGGTGVTFNIKNVGVSQSYIKVSTVDNTVYAGGIFGMGSGLYDFYGTKTTPADTENDEFTIPGDSKPTKLPTISNCFVDHTCYIEAYAVGGIGCPGGAAIVVRDCIVTASLVGSASTREGGLVGSFWANSSRVYDSVSFPQTDNISIGGNQQWIETITSICAYTEDVYYYGSKPIFGTTRVKRPQWRVGEEAKTAMPNLDWENTWRVEKDGTPVLRVFDKENRSGSMFSDKQYNIADVKINFITGDPDIELDPKVGKPYEKVTFPTISRTGYTFTGWYAFPDCSLLYPYEYFLSRDISVYAGWKKSGITQDFEKYTYSSYDCDLSRWNYNKPGSRVGYYFEYVHTGTKSMQLLDNSAESADLLINYEEWLTIGQDYTMTFYVATDKANNATTLSLVQNNYPDYLGTEVSVEPMVTITGQPVGAWKQYSYNFTAQTNWVSIRATGNSSLFIDDVVIGPKGTLIADTSNNYVSGDLGVISPQTADSTTVVALIAVIVCGAIIAIVSKKNAVEVIEKN